MPRNPDPTKRRGSGLSRRDMLRGSALAAGGLLIGIQLDVKPARADGPASPGARFDAFIHVATDDRVTVTMPAVDMGQGTYTMQAMCVAEELDIGLDQVVSIPAPPDAALYANPELSVQATGGSTSTAAWSIPLRKAGATARAMLVQAAAMGWGVDPATLATDHGVITDPSTGRSLRYGEVANRAAGLKPPAEVKLKDPSQFRLIGKPTRRIDSPDKVMGKTTFGIDVMLPGMKFAVLRASPAFGGKVGSVDTAPALAVPGVSQVVVLDDLVAVVANNTWTASKGLDALDIQWDPGAFGAMNQAELWAGLEKASQGKGAVARDDGGVLELLGSGDVVEEAYELPLLAHAPMEPFNCTAHVKGGTCELWTGTQAPGMVQSAAAKALSIDASAVKLNNYLPGGGFGRRLEGADMDKVVRIAREVDGPVKVTWMRDEDVRQDYFRPMYNERIKARIDGDKITAWRHRVTGASFMKAWFGLPLKNGIDDDAVNGAANTPYDLGKVLVEYVDHETALPVGSWRGVGPNGAVFAVECFLDKIAKQLGKDPVDFRRSMLANKPRALAALNHVVEKAGWGQPVPPSPFGSRVGRGVAVLDGFGSYLACVADVAVNDEGDVRVTRVVISADCGKVINPEGLLVQIQSGTVFGLSAVLHGVITIKNGAVEQSNFNDYRILRIDEMPKIEGHIIPSDEASGGIGEPGVVVSQPAVANAVFAATGVQQTRMPLNDKLAAKGG